MTTPLVGPDGKRYAFEGSPEDLAAAQKMGWRVDDGTGPTVVESVKAAAAEAAPVVNAASLGALQGATAGGYGAYVGATQDPATKAAVKANLEEHPVASGVGELAGMLTSPVNLLAPEIEGPRAATVLGRIGQKALSGGAIGSLYGAGNAVSDAALGDTQLTAERLVAGAGLGMLLGGVGGGMGGAIEEGAAKVLPKLSTVIKGGQSALDDVADHATLRAFRNTAKELQKYGDGQVADAVETVRARGHLKLSPEAMEKSIGADVAAVGKTKGAFIDAAEAAGSKPNHVEAFRALDDWYASKSPLEQQAIESAYREARTALEDVATSPKSSGWKALDKWKQDLQARAKYRGVSTDDSLTGGLKRELAGVAREELDRQLVPALGKDGQAFLDAKKLYGSLKTAEKLAHTGSGRGSGFNLVDIAASVGLGGAHPFGLIGGLGTKLLREHGAAIVAQVADRLSKSPALEAVAQSFAKSLPAVAPKLGTYGPSLMLAAERGPALALAQHMVTSQVDPEYAANARVAGLMPESPAEHNAALGKATDIAAIRGAMKAHDEAVEQAFAHIIKGTKPADGSPVLKTQEFGAKQLRRDSKAAHAHIVGQIRQLATNPQALVERVSQNTRALGAAAPGVSAHMVAVADRAVKYLATQAEVPPKAGPLAHEWVPNESERHQFALKLEAVQEPMSILRHATKGTLTRIQLDAVSAVHPRFARQIQDKAMEQLASGGSIPYRSRMMLTLLTGIDADGTMSPKAIAANQNAIASAGSRQSRSTPSRDDGKLGIADRAATPGQRNELKQEQA